METIDNKILFACMNGYEKYALKYMEIANVKHFQELGDGNNVLYWACYHKMSDVIDELLPRMTIESINRINYKNMTALSCLCNERFSDNISSLVIKLIPYSTYKNIYRVITNNWFYRHVIFSELTEHAINKLMQKINDDNIPIIYNVTL